MIKEVNVTVYKVKNILEVFERLIDLIRRQKRNILLHCIQWSSITAISFLLVNGSATLALVNISTPNSGPARSRFPADYGEWALSLVPRVDPDIVEEIKRDNPQNPEVFNSYKFFRSFLANRYHSNTF